MITEIAVSFSIPQKFLPIRMLLFQISYGCYIVYLRKKVKSNRVQIVLI